MSFSIEAIAEAGGREYLRPTRQRLNVATFDAVMVGAMRRVAGGHPLTPEAAVKALDILRHDPDFDAATSTQSDTEENVRNRIRIATSAFAA